MAVLPFIDRVDNLEASERHGVYRRLVRRCRVVWGEGSIPPSNYDVLAAALEVCPGPLDIPPEYLYLALTERHAKVVENEPTVVDVDLVYEHVLDGPNQYLVSPTYGVLYGKGKCSVTEKTTNFYYPYGDTAQPRTQIAVAHTYGPQDIGSIAQGFVPGLPRTIIQGGEIKIPYPQANFTLKGLLYTDNPWSIASLFINSVNGALWQNQVKYYWLCSTVSWEILDVVNLLYDFEFEFQGNSDSWYPTVVFNDQRTGRPPHDVEAADIYTFIGPYSVLDSTLNNVPVNPPRQGPPPKQPAGYWIVPALRPVDYTQLFSAYFEGVSNVPPQS
jgi:hypothetical protein